MYFIDINSDMELYHSLGLWLMGVKRRGSGPV
jgi:hypothetical protein